MARRGSFETRNLRDRAIAGRPRKRWHSSRKKSRKFKRSSYAAAISRSRGSRSRLSRRASFWRRSRRVHFLGQPVPATRRPADGRPLLRGWRGRGLLTARVIANRLWQHHFGRRIVATPSFGVRGEPPSHPELLDWLASELIREGWRFKPLHRLMVTSATYRQTSRADAKLIAFDPDNTLFARMNRRRLDAEGVRDAMLAVSGRAPIQNGRPRDPRTYRKGNRGPDLHREAVDLWPEDRNPSEHLRRSLYLFRKRSVQYTLFDAFDAPDADALPR